MFRHRYRSLLALLLVVVVAAPATATSSSVSDTELRYWPLSYLEMELLVDEAPLPPGELRGALREAASTWNATGIGPEILVEEPRRDRAAKVAEHDGRNLAFFVTEDWPGDPRATAFTYSYVDLASGEILEVDIALNAAHHAFSSSPGADDGAYDLQTILTHELGHALGLSDLTDAHEAVMHYVVAPGTVQKRDLSVRDVMELDQRYHDVSLVEPMGCAAQSASGAWLPWLALASLLTLIPRAPRRERHEGR